MDRAQQCIVGMRLTRTRTLQPGAHGLQMAPNFCPQDFQQHGIHLHRRRFWRGRRRRLVHRRLRGCGPLHRLGRRRKRLQQDVLPGSQAIGDRLQRRDVGRDGRTIAQRGVQGGQQPMRLGDERDHCRAGRPRAVQHAVEHVLHVPGELAEDLGADQPTAALEGVEDAPNRAQGFDILRRDAPGRQQGIEVGDLLLKLFQEDLADLVVDLVARGLEPGRYRSRGRADRHRHGGRCWRLLTLRLCGRGIRLARGRDALRRAVNRHIRRHIRRCRRWRSRLAGRKRPVAQRFQADAGLVQQIQALAERIVQRLEVILHSRQGIGQGIQRLPARHLPTFDQLALSELAQGLQEAGRFRLLQDTQGARDFIEQARDWLQRGVIPVGFDECDEGVPHLREIADGRAGERAHDLARFLRQQVAGLRFRAAIAEMRHLVIERMVDGNQRASHIQQLAFVERALAGGDRMHDVALRLDHAACAIQPQHFQGVADLIQRLHLHLQFLDLALAGAQEQIQRVLDPEQVLLDRCRDGIQQGAIATHQTAAGMREFGLGWRFQQRRQRILAQLRRAARRAQGVDQRQQHDRDVAMAALQALQIVGQLDHAAHQLGQRILARRDAASLQRDRQLLHLLCHHRRRLQLEHAQRALHLMQMLDAGLHRRRIARRLGERLELDPRLPQRLVDLRLHPAERGMVDRVPQRGAHDATPAVAGAGMLAWRVLFIRVPVSALPQAGSLKSATERRRSAAS